MKKIIITTAFIFLGLGVLSAQTLDSIAHHYAGSDGEYDVDMRGFVALRDGTVLANCQLFILDEQYYYVCDYGNRLYKIDPNGPAVIDSLFIEDGDMNYFLVERNPFGDDNVIVRLVRDLEEDRTLLHIRYLDDNLQFDDSKEQWIPLCDTAFKPLTDSYCLDPNGDIVVRFKLPGRKLHFVRIGFDGMVKSHRIYDDNEMIYQIYPRSLQVLNNAPIEYGYCGTADHPTYGEQDHVFVLDSVFEIKEVYDIPHVVSSIIPFGGQACDGGDGTVMFYSRFDDRLPNNGNGVQLTRFGREGLTPLATVCFYTKPMVTSGSATMGCAMTIGIAPDGKGGWYYAYTSQDPVVFGVGQIGVARLDHNLNVLWHRYCLEPEGFSRLATTDGVVIMDDGRVAVGGLVYGLAGEYPSHFFFLFLDNDGVGTPETEAFIRPYAFWPNPVGDELRMEFSPDVTPSRVELYDLNGRLLRTWRNGLETIGMADLSSGTYTLKVTLTDGKTYSDKVVKK